VDVREELLRDPRDGDVVDVDLLIAMSDSRRSSGPLNCDSSMTNGVATSAPPRTFVARRGVESS
jgi:hypothetical protein